MKNDYKIYDDYVEIIVKRRNGDIHKIKVCHKGFEKLKQNDYKWHVWYNKNNRSFYAMTTIYKGMFEGKVKQEILYMHRYLTNAQKGDYVDHVNHETLDNRLTNLKITSNSDNLLNRKGANKNSTTGIRNVNSNGRGGYVVQFCKNNKRVVVGEFEDLEVAKKVADEYRKTKIQ